MLPSGHLASGYLSGTLLATWLPGLVQDDSRQIFIALVALFAVIPDLDEFWVFAKIGRAIGSKAGFNHRKLLTHTPLLHLLIAVLIFALGAIAQNQLVVQISFAYLLGTMMHLFFDSFAYGVMWLWPFSKKLFAFRRAGVNIEIPPDLKLRNYWIAFLKVYVKDTVFVLEILLIILAVNVFVSSS